jgi:hypothetical protein
LSERISINYSIKADELASEVDRLFDVAVQSIADATNEYSTLGDSLSPESLRQIASAKDFALDLYYRLSDLENIIKSYLHYVSSQDTGVSQESISPSGLDSMYKKLAVLAKTFEAGGSEHEVSD